MDLLASDDELLLMELERRDGIYSFIFHELENSKLQDNQNKTKHKEENSLKESQPMNDLKKWQKTATETSHINVTKSALLASSSALLTTSEAARAYSYADYYVKGTTTTDFGKSWQTHFNFQFPMNSSSLHHSPFQQFCSLRTFNVRRAKTPFSHIYAPLVRNRCHKLKETKEYKSFMQNITQVPDLRELFPLDPDVHAPFEEDSEDNNYRGRKIFKVMDFELKNNI